MLGFGAAIGEHAVDPLIAADVLAQRSHGVIAEYRCVKGVESFLGCGRSMGGTAVVVEL